jgi:hypothetical protein
MENPAAYYVFAQDCERLAKEMPEHKSTLLEIACAWRMCAAELERDIAKVRASNEMFVDPQ